MIPRDHYGYGMFVKPGPRSGQKSLADCLSHHPVHPPPPHHPLPLAGFRTSFFWYLLVQITPQDKFLVLACDGVFDVLTNEEVVNDVHKKMKLHADAQRSVRSEQKLTAVCVYVCVCVCVCFFFAAGSRSICMHQRQPTNQQQNTWLCRRRVHSRRLR